MVTQQQRSKALAAIDRADVGVFAFRIKDRPVACAVTPYVGGDSPVVASTLAYVTKMGHVRKDPRVALLAGGILVQGGASVETDLKGDRFAAELFDQELRKYPPAKQLKRIPGHRRLFAWYFGRVLAPIRLERTSAEQGSDEVTLTTLDEDGVPRVTPLAVADLHAPAFSVGGQYEGPAFVLAHRESADKSQLRQVSIRGSVCDGTLIVQRLRGTLDLGPTPGPVAQIRELRAMARLGRAGRALAETWH